MACPLDLGQEPVFPDIMFAAVSEQEGAVVAGRTRGPGFGRVCRRRQLPPN